MLFVLCLPVKAYDISDDSNTDSLTDYTKPIEDLLGSEEKELLHAFTEAGSLETGFKKTADMILTQLKEVCSTFSCTLLIVLLGSILNHVLTLQDNLHHRQNSALYHITQSLCLVLPFTSIFQTTLQETTAFLERLQILLTSSSAGITALCAIGGNTQASIVYAAGLSFLNQALNAICSNAILPMCRILFCCVLTMPFCYTETFYTFSKSIRNATVLILSLCATVFSFILALQNQLSQSADNACTKTIRFLLAKTVPIIGSSVAEATRTVAAGISVLRSGFGAVGVAAIFIIVGIPLLKLFLQRTAFSVLIVFSKLIGNDDATGMMEHLSYIYDILIALTSFCCVLGMLIFILFTKTVSAIGT